MDTDKELEVMIGLSRERYTAFKNDYEVMGLLEAKRLAYAQFIRRRDRVGRVEATRVLIQIAAIAKLALSELYSDIEDEEYKTHFTPIL
jgi:hypothetical protein